MNARAESLLRRLPTTNLIAGAFGPESVRLSAVIDPATGETLTQVQTSTPADLDVAVAAAAAAQPEWGRRTPKARADLLVVLSNTLEASIDDLAALESLNVGKPLGVSTDEMHMAVDVLRFIAGAARSAAGPATEEYVEDHLSMLAREPLGVVGIMAPWNYPLLTTIFKLAPALAAGNTVVIKPSERTPLSALLFIDLVRDLLPAGVVNLVLGSGRVVGAAMSAHPGLALVSITGSIESGKAVARSGAETLKRVHLELGGKAPVVVFDDADVDAAVQAVRTAGFWNAGQECGAATRVLVHASRYDEVVSKLETAASSLVVGGPFTTDSAEMGPVITEAHLARVAELVERGIADGARLITGGARLDRPGFFYAPTVLADVPRHTELDGTEVFGPVVTAQPFDTEEEAIEISNDGPFGLSASVWTRDFTRARRVARSLDYGTVWVNAHLVLAVEMPWSGFKESGYGYDLSALSLNDYTRLKHVMLKLS